MPVDTDTINVSFKFFGLEPSASLKAAKEAFRRYAKEFHPDKFPKDSDAQKLASEKMIAANSHYDNLKEFFEKYPDGKPAEEGQTFEGYHEPQDDDDWESWEKQRHTAFDDELNEWIERQEKIQRDKAAHLEGFRRSKLVTYCRVGLIVITLAMWMGWFSELSKLNKGVTKETAQQNYLSNQPHYIDPVTGMDTTAAWRQHVNEKLASEGFVSPDQKLKEMPGKFILLLLWSAGASWLLFSQKGKALVEKYLAEAKK